MHVESILEAEGHLVDSQILTSVFDAVIRHDSAFEVLSFDIGRTNTDYSRLRLKVTSPDQVAHASLLEELVTLGCHPLAETRRRRCGPPTRTAARPRTSTRRPTTAPSSATTATGSKSAGSGWTP